MFTFINSIFPKGSEREKSSQSIKKKKQKKNGTTENKKVATFKQKIKRNTHENLFQLSKPLCLYIHVYTGFGY